MPDKNDVPSMRDKKLIKLERRSSEGPLVIVNLPLFVYSDLCLKDYYES